MKFTYIPTGIKRELVRFGVDCDQKGYIVGNIGGRKVSIHSNGQTIFSFTHIEVITLGAGEVAGGEVTWVWIGLMRLVTGPAKERFYSRVSGKGWDGM